MLVCATCGSRWDEDGLPAATLAAATCPLCEGALVDIDDAVPDDGAPLHAGVARTLRAHLLGVGA